MKSLDTIIRNARKTDKDKLVIVKLSELEKFQLALADATDLAYNLAPFFKTFQERVQRLKYVKDKKGRMELDYSVFTIELDLKEMQFLQDAIDGVLAGDK